jgi:hypothetical protein
MFRFFVAVAVTMLLLAGPARADEAADQAVRSTASLPPSPTLPRNLVSDQFSVGATPGSPSLPRTGFVSDRLSGSNALTESLGVLFGFTVTRDLGAPPSAGSHFSDRGGTIFRFSAGTEWQVTPRWALIPMVSGSPSTTTRTSTTIPFQDPTTGVSMNVAGDLRVRSSSVGGELSAEFDTLDAWVPELVVTSTAGVVNYWSTQKLLTLQLASGPETQAMLAQQCQSQGCSPEVQSLLTKPATSVLQGYGELDLTGIVRHTELGISGTAFAYSRDPSQLGFFGVAAFARGPSIGDGVAIAPLRFSAQGHALQKFARFRIGATGEYGRYVDGEGSTVIVSVKPAYDVTARIRLWATGTWQRDDLTGIGTAQTFIGAMGLRWAY